MHSIVDNYSAISTKWPVVLLTMGYFLLSTSCNNPEQTIANPHAGDKENIIKEKLIDINKKRLDAESEVIDLYIKRHELNMITTPSGLRYHKIKENMGDSIHQGDKVSIAYSVYLLDGTYCYSSDSSGVLTFKVGEYDVPNGFHEMALLLRVGEKAQLIIPSHLAYGITGDNNKIPLSSPLNCFMEIKKKF